MNDTASTQNLGTSSSAGKGLLGTDSGAQKKPHGAASLNANGKPVKKGGGINLLTDTEQVIARETFKSNVYRGSSIVVAICLLLGSLAMGAWTLQNRREESVKNKIEIANQQLEDMSEVLQVAILYDRRLKTVEQLWPGSTTLPARILGDLEKLAAETDASVVQYTFQEKTFQAIIKVPSVAQMDALIAKLRDLNTPQIWKPIGIEKTERLAVDDYRVIFKGLINKSYEQNLN